MALEQDGKMTSVVDTHVLSGFELRYEAIIVYFWQEKES